jgi:diguanylate cyclase (GGDEF)-like protein
MTRRASPEQAASLMQQVPRIVAPVALILFTFIASTIVKPFGAHGEARLSNMLEAAVACASGIVVIASARSLTARDQRTWQLFGLGALSWGSGQAFAFCYELAAGARPPVPSPADVGYLAMIPLMLIALVRLPIDRPRLEGRIRVLLDALIVIAAIATVSWLLFLGPVYRDIGMSTVHKLVASAYPAGDIVLMCALVGGIARGWLQCDDSPIPLLLLGIAAFIAADLSVYYLSLHGTYSHDGVLGVGWPLGFCLIAEATRARAASAKSGRGAASASAVRQLHVVDTVGKIVLHALLAALAGMLLSTAVRHGDLIDNVFYFLAVSTIVIVFARQFFTVRENERLNADLRELSHNLGDAVRARTHELESAVASLRSEVIEKHRVATTLRTTEAHLRAVLANAPLLLFGLDSNGVFTLCEGKALDALGLDSIAVIGESIFDVYKGVPTIHEHIRYALSGASFDGTVDLGDVSLDIRYEAIKDEGDAVIGVIGAALDITRRRRAEQQLVHLAFHDPLTTLPNRARFMERLRQALRETEGRRARPAVLFIDLDRFKIINDSLGHAAGDELLVGAAERLSTCVRAGDLVARLGGDEFTVLLRPIAQPGEAEAIAALIVEAFMQPFQIAGRDLFVSASVGVAWAPPGAFTPDELIRKADIALYQAKGGGRARAVLFDDAMDVRAVKRLEVENDLRRALERDELLLYYQPEVDLRNNEVVGMEALVRWKHPTRGIVPPSEFVALAEETGLIIPLGRWVLEQACRQTMEWQAHRPGKRPLIVGVNLSMRQLQETDIASVVKDVLRSTGMPPGALRLEITESMAMQEVEQTIAVLEGLKQIGVELAIDDFGTGYSSLSYLARLPIDILKIDRSFVQALGTERSTGLIVEATIALAHTLGMEVTAEGIESAQQLARLKALRCDRGQGFYFAKALPAEIIGAVLVGAAVHTNALSA